MDREPELVPAPSVSLPWVCDLRGLEECMNCGTPPGVHFPQRPQRRLEPERKEDFQCRSRILRSAFSEDWQSMAKVLKVGGVLTEN